MLFIIPTEVYTDKMIWLLELAQICLHFSMAIFWILWVPTTVDCRDPRWGRCYESDSEDPKVVESIRTIISGERLLKDNFASTSHIMLVKRSLQLVKMLASTSENHAVLQQLGIEILTSLAPDEDAKEKIGSAGRVFRELLCIFFKQGLPENQDTVRAVSGEALAMLTLESEKNCRRILRLEALEKLVEALKEPVLCVNSARIMRIFALTVDMIAATS